MTPVEPAAGQAPGRLSPLRGRILVLASAVLWSLSGLFAKSPAFADWPDEVRGVLLGLWRAVFASLILATMVRRPVWDWRLLVGGGVFALMNASYLTSLVWCESSLAIWLQYSAPLWVALGSWWIFGERLAPADRAPWLLMMGGVGVILLAESNGASRPLGVWLGLASGVCFAGIVLTLRWLRQLDPAWVVLFNHALTALLLSPALFRSGCWPVGNQWWLLAAFGIVQMGLPYLLFARGMKSVSSSEASCLLLLEPVLLPLWVWIAWRSDPGYVPPRSVTLLGGALILAGLIWMIQRKR